MRKKIFTFLLALVTSVGLMNAAVDGKLPGAFTINSNGDLIAFSKGNLQYHCTNHVWQFATNQYDMIGDDNANISDSYDGWIDLFGYGTGNNPTLVSTSYNAYSTFTDWGVNAISNGGNEANLWRTLTKDEWVYMFNIRTDASDKYGMATVANVPGIIVLPDVYVGPAINTDHDAWDNKVISSSEWAAYEAAGAVFLPAAGFRSGTTMDNVGSYGFCWSSTPDDAMHSYKLSLSPYVAQPQGFGLRYEGLSVRLVQATSTPTDQDIADVVIALINAIPNPVAYNDECKNAIDAARAAYDALTAAQKALVANYGVLLDAETAYAQLTPTPSGECGAQGDNLLWELNTSTGVLTITGSGAMYDWAYDTDRPWYSNKGQITSVVLPSGITTIGKYAFKGIELASINMTENYPAGLTAINQEAFCNTKLTSVTIPESVVTIGQDAFYLSQDITDVYCYADPNNLTWNDFYCDDFNKSPAKSTQCHVKDCYLAVYNSEWNSGSSSTDVNVTFVGDLPGDCGGSTPTPTPTDEQVSTNEDPENPSYHYSTFFHSTQNYKLTNDGTQAFIADLSGSDLVLTEIAHGEQVFPANTAVILRKTGSADPVVLTPTEENGVSVNPDDNSLEGVDVATPVTDITGLTTTNCYVLSGSVQHGVGFYRINSENLKAHKAYVKYAGSPSNAPKKMRFVFSEEQTATGMENVQNEETKAQKVMIDGVMYIIRGEHMYDAQGQIVK